VAGNHSVAPGFVHEALGIDKLAAVVYQGPQRPECLGAETQIRAVAKQAPGVRI